MQITGLKAILGHCSINIPYYRVMFLQSGYSENGDLVSEYKKIPSLTKKIIKDNFPVGILDKNRKTYFIDNTSGSSGVKGDFCDSET